MTIWWVWAITILSAASALVAVVAVAMSGSSRSASLVGSIIGIGVAAGVVGLLLLVRLTTEVRDDGLRISFRPFMKRTIAWDEVESAEARIYHPIREYGGWGIRWGPSGRAYNMSGNQGVQLVLRDGKRLLIGSQRAEELAAAIETARR